MANIIGNNPQDWAANQVKLRQHLLGQKNKTPEILAWQTNKTAWIRAISAVQVDEKTAEKLTGGRQHMGGGTLAQEYVLFNGTVGLGKDYDKDGNVSDTWAYPNSGVYSGPNPQEGGFQSSAYGFEYESSRGLVPMPGIEDLSITTYNRGSLRRASFKIKAYNKKQFAILDALFMRPGFTLLLEWGHTTYFKGTPENPVYTTANFNTLPFMMMNDFLEGRINGSQSRLLAAIKKERGNGQSGDGTTIDPDKGKVKGSNGNYDGFYGKVTNFVWGLNPDGSYNIEVKAISTGDIIESLTIDRVEPSTPKVEPKPKDTRTKVDSSENDTTVTLSLEDKYGKSFTKTFKNLNEAKKHREWWRDNTDFTLNAKKLFDFNGADAEVIKEFKEYKKKYPTTINNFKLKPPPNTLVPQEPGNDILLASKDKSKLNAFLYKNFEYLDSNFEKNAKPIKTNSINNRTINTFNILGEIEEYGDLIMLQPFTSQEIQDHTGEIIGSTYRPAKNAPYQYILLGRLLEFIEDELLIYNGGLNVEQQEALQKELDKLPTEKEKDAFLDKKGLSGFNEKILNFDLDGQNYMYTQPTQFSSDPNVCVIPFQFPLPSSTKKNKVTGEDGKITTEETLEFAGYVKYYDQVLKDCGFSTESPYVANMLHIPVNLNYIGKVLKQTTSNNSIPLLRFLEQIFFGINTALGSINKFSVTYDHDLNTVIFRDDTPLDPKIVTQTVVPVEQQTRFNVNGWKPQDEDASFVNNVSISTTLSNKFATMISIGAQSQKASDVTNSTSFSRWNTGLNDSVTPSKLSKAGLNSKKSTQNKPFELFKKSIISLNKPPALITSFYQSSIMPSGEILSTAQSLNSNLNKYITTLENKEGLFNPTSTSNNPPSSQGFIPFSMNLDMDGFSGLRIYEKFYITTEVLPTSYPETLNFLCKGITHTVNNNGWKTKIDSLTITNVDNLKPNPNPGTKPVDLFAPEQPDPESDSTSGDDEIPYLKGFLKDREGFRDVSYQDSSGTNKYGTFRIGYGTDKITEADGNVIEVTPSFKWTDGIDGKLPKIPLPRTKFNTVDKEGAERDLDRRIKKDFRPEAIKSLKRNGVDYWELPKRVKVVFVDIAYNYGSIYNEYAGAYKNGGVDGLIRALKRRSEIPGNSRGRRLAEIDVLNNNYSFKKKENEVTI